MKRLMLLASVLLLVSSTARTQQGDVASATLTQQHWLPIGEKSSDGSPRKLEKTATEQVPGAAAFRIRAPRPERSIRPRRMKRRGVGSYQTGE
jgi:hypothetical protein